MDTSHNSSRKNFKCVFNTYVTKENQDGIVRSVISQFDGYYADPEVTLTDEGFVLSLTLGENLSATAARDKILWNRFIDRVSAQDTIRKIQILRLPSAGLMDFGGRIEGQGSVGGFGPGVDPAVGDTHVDEKLYIDQNYNPKYKIDGGQNPKTLGETASTHYADKTDMASEGQAFVQGLTPDGLGSEATIVDSGEKTVLDSGQKVPKLMMGFRVIAIDSDTNGSFTLTQPNGFHSVGEPPRDGGLHEEAGSATGIGGGAPLSSGASFFVYDPKNAQGTAPGDVRNSDSASAAPFANINTGNKKIEPEVEDDISSVEIPQARGGGQSVPDGGQVEGWYASNFGLNETYDYLGDLDDNYFI